jgi:molybdate transport system substrate-binding protein
MSKPRHGIQRHGFVALAICLALVLASPARAGQDVLVFAAASLKTALDEVAARCAAQTGKTTTASYAGSSALAKQIEAGAPADIFVSADLDWMDYLAERDLIRPETRTNLLGNDLVLIAPADSAAAATIEPGFPIAALLGEDGRLAVADIAAVPAGKYAKAALEALGVWTAVADRIVQAANVRAALALVARGEAPLGIVYRTDAMAEPGVEVLDTFPEDTHPPIVYPVALLRDSAGADAAAALACLQSDEARAIFAAHGFLVPE